LHVTILAKLADERVHSSAIITTTLNELCAELHNRMPVILPPQVWPAPLGEEPAVAIRTKPRNSPAACRFSC
jgi:putative SOS response-associated peptidase YedK